jgi:hypothetical protein
VEAFALAGKIRAALICVSTDRDHDIDVAIKKLFVALRAVFADLKAYLRHGRDSEGMDVARWIAASAVHFEATTGTISQNGFSHLTSTGISSAEDQNLFFVHHKVQFRVFF